MGHNDPWPNLGTYITVWFVHWLPINQSTEQSIIQSFNRWIHMWTISLLDQSSRSPKPINKQFNLDFGQLAYFTSMTSATRLTPTHTQFSLTITSSLTTFSYDNIIRCIYCIRSQVRLHLISLMPTRKMKNRSSKSGHKSLQNELRLAWAYTSTREASWNTQTEFIRIETHSKSNCSIHTPNSCRSIK